MRKIVFLLLLSIGMRAQIVKVCDSIKMDSLINQTIVSQNLTPVVTMLKDASHNYIFWCDTNTRIATKYAMTGWGLTGNSISNSNSAFLGTTNAHGLTFKTNGVRRGIIDSIGRMGLGTTTPGQALVVATGSGNIQYSGGLMPSGITGTSGYVLTSQGSGLDVWKTASSGGGNVTGSSPSTGTALVYFPAFSQHNLTRLSYVGGVIELDTTTKLVAITGTELDAQNQAINMTDGAGSDGGGFYYDYNSNTGMGDVINNDDNTWVGAFDKSGTGGGGLVNISAPNGVLISPSLTFSAPTNTNYQFEVSGTCKISGNVTLSLPTYANDAAAGVGGLTTGQLYQQTTTHYILIKQ